MHVTPSSIRQDFRIRVRRGSLEDIDIAETMIFNATMLVLYMKIQNGRYSTLLVGQYRDYVSRIISGPAWSRC